MNLSKSTRFTFHPLPKILSFRALMFRAVVSQNFTAASGLLPAKIPGDSGAAGSRTAIDTERNWRHLSQKKNRDQPSHQNGSRRETLNLTTWAQI